MLWKQVRHNVQIWQRWERIYVYGMFRICIINFFSILPAAKLILSPLYSGVASLRTSWTKYHLWPVEIFNTGFPFIMINVLIPIVIYSTIIFWVLGNQDGVSCDFHIGKQHIMSRTCKVHTPDIWNAMQFLLIWKEYLRCGVDMRWIRNKYDFMNIVIYCHFTVWSNILYIHILWGKNTLYGDN